MGKYSNVNATSLQNVANNAINELSRYKMTSTKQNIDNTKNLYSTSKITLTNAMASVINKKDINGSIPKLEETLKKLSTAASYIKTCQDLEKEIAQLERDKYDSNGNTNYWVVWQINSKKNSLSSYESKVDRLLS